MYRPRPKFVKSSQPSQTATAKQEIRKQRLTIPTRETPAAQTVPPVSLFSSPTDSANCVPDICKFLGLGALECGFLKLQGPITPTQLYSIVYSLAIGVPPYIGANLADVASKEVTRWYISNVLSKTLPQLVAFFSLMALLRYKNVIDTKTLLFVSFFVVLVYVQSLVYSYLNDMRVVYETVKSMSDTVMSNWSKNSGALGALVTSSYLGSNFCPV